MEIRRSVDGDWGGIWPIWHRVVAGEDTYVWPADTAEADARRLWMLAPAAEVWVATDDPRVVATAVLKPNQIGLGDHVANASFMVDPEHEGVGVGRALAEVVIDRARALGYRAMQFNAVVATNTRAIALWRSLGFVVVGIVPGSFRHRTEGHVDLLIMHRALQ